MKLNLIILLLIALLGCEAVPKDAKQTHIDNKLVGVWEGEYLEKDGTIKKWMQTRKEDGTYRIEFRLVEVDGTVNRFSELGLWWIKDGLFHELVPSSMEHPDSYQYHFKDDNCIEFLLVDSLESIDDIGKYYFVECRSDTIPLAIVID
ncbi:hypothetical protein SAMN05216302_100377 [Nitrosomonas aestuarii]|uniref:Lipocalin-like domain-containing protein n=1 Tax=Nitrosomonas aestuarii TaxID=52441 RepID=A0A1I3Y859_9PROT|nr:hypothetical protein [Nitrosomonas aestuarii]SFK28054.1 hypothetical protein SAMN05216302_100377 [Nitrosomonas aestuarii]